MLKHLLHLVCPSCSTEAMNEFSNIWSYQYDEMLQWDTRTDERMEGQKLCLKYVGSYFDF